MSIHYLKTHPEHFAAVAAGIKTAELRNDDRNYQVGDILVLQEWCPQRYADASDELRQTGMEWDRVENEARERAYTGSTLYAKVTHKLTGKPWLGDGYAMLSIRVSEFYGIVVELIELARKTAGEPAL